MKKILLIMGAIFLSACSTINSQYVLQDASTKKSVYEAIKNHKELIEISKHKFKDDPSAHNRLDLANSYYDAGDLRSALYYARPLLESSDANAYVLTAKIKESQGALPGAEKDAKEAVKLDSKNAAAYNILGVIQTKLGKFTDALASFYKAKELFLSDEIVDNNLGLLEIARRRYKEASSYLYPLYSRGYDDKKTISNLVLSLAKSNQDDLALRIIQKEGLSSDPKKLLHSLKHAKK